jgi:hypothetical protein
MGSRVFHPIEPEVETITAALQHRSFRTLLAPAVTVGFRNRHGFENGLLPEGIHTDTLFCIDGPSSRAHHKVPCPTHKNHDDKMELSLVFQLFSNNRGQSNADWI